MSEQNDPSKIKILDPKDCETKLKLLGVPPEVVNTFNFYFNAYMQTSQAQQIFQAIAMDFIAKSDLKEGDVTALTFETQKKNDEKLSLGGLVLEYKPIIKDEKPDGFEYKLINANKPSLKIV